jgi:hypothetical protein
MNTQTFETPLHLNGKLHGQLRVTYGYDKKIGEASVNLQHMRLIPKGFEEAPPVDITYLVNEFAPNLRNQMTAAARNNYLNLIN